MSADPSKPPQEVTESGGRVMRSWMFDEASQGKNTNSNISTHPANMTFEADQDTVKPYRKNIRPDHPCIEQNTALGKCMDSCDPRMMLAGRVAECNSQRLALMTCFTKHKHYDQNEARMERNLPPREEKLAPWWQLWYTNGFKSVTGKWT